MTTQHTLKINDTAYNNLKRVADKRNITVSALISQLATCLDDVQPVWRAEPVADTAPKLPKGLRGC